MGYKLLALHELLYVMQCTTKYSLAHEPQDVYESFILSLVMVCAFELDSASKHPIFSAFSLLVLDVYHYSGR